MIDRRGGRTLTFHAGATGGSRAWIGLDRDAQVGVVLLAATSEWVDDAGEQLLLQKVRRQR